MSQSPDVERVTTDGVYIRRTSGHTYHVHLMGEDDTNPVEGLPSVTTVAKVYDPGRGAALMGWAVKQALAYISDKVMSKLPSSRQEFQRIISSAKGAAARKRNAAGSFGQDFHNLAEQVVISHVTGDGVDEVIAGASEGMRTGLNAIAKYMRENVPVGTKVWTEAPILGIVDQLLYVGCVDVVVWLDDGPPMVIDFKTGNYFYDEAWLQMAAYVEGLRREDENVGEVRRIVLHVPKFGNPVAIERKRSPAKADDEAWKRIVHAHYYAKTNFGDNKITPLAVAEEE